MDPKRKKALYKLFNVKIGKRPKKTPLKYRRSLSVPHLLCDQAMPTMLGSAVTEQDFVGSSDQDDTASEASAMAFDSLSTTDIPLPYESPEQLTVPDAAPSTVVVELPSVPCTPPSTMLLNQITAPNTPALVNKSVDQFNILSTSPPSVPDIPALLERPTFLNFPITKDRSDKKTTTWYIDNLDNDSICSTPSEEHPYSLWHLEQESSVPVQPLREICVTGSAEDMNEGLNESNDYDESFPREQRSSGAGSEALAGQKVHYYVTINLKEGKNLVIRDRSGTSDPYVKFKLDGKTLYKSKVVYKNLNPTWNESFSFHVRDLEQTIYVMVYDRDLRSRDFMGSSTITLNKLELDKLSEMTLPLQDPGSQEDDMGVIVLDVSVSISEGPTKRNLMFQKWQRRRRGSYKILVEQVRVAAAQKSQVWTGVYTMVLVEGQDMQEGGQGDVYVCFRLGEQRFQSKNQCIKANPQWRQRFDFNHFEDGQPDLLAVEVLCKRGRKCVECWGQLEVNLSQLTDHMKHTYTYSVGTGKGRLVFLAKLRPCSGVSISDMSSAPLDDGHRYEMMLEQYKLKNTLKNLQDVGYLQVKVVRAADLLATDLNGKSNPFCLVELGNSKLQTQTVYKTIHPEWRTAFTLPVKDIHDVLEVTVYGEDGDKEPDFLGTVAIPLLTISNGQQITSLLKKEDLAGPTKGSITLEMSIFYNPVRAAIRTFNPKEMKFEEDSPKFNKKLLARNIFRVRRISTAILCTLQYIQSCFQWESTQRSIMAFLIFVLMVWHFELFMLPLFLLVLFGWNYFRLTTGTGSNSQDLETMSVADDEDEDEKESEKRGLMDKFHMVQEIVITLQNTLDEVACLGERVKNTFNWSVPFLSFLACLVLFIATVALYYIPLRYIVLLWGINKFTKKLRNPHAVDHNELLDFLQRVPSDVQKVQYSELRAGTQKKKR